MISLTKLIFSLALLLIAIVFHEYAHGWVAYRFGDPTAKNLGRLTLNPIAHIDTVGTILIPIMLVIFHSPVVIGWAKPVPINYMNLRHPKRDLIYVSAAGPLANILLGVIVFLIIMFIVKNLDNFELDIYRPLNNPLKYVHLFTDFISKLNDVKNALATYSDEVVHDVIEHVKHKGGPAIGEKFVLELLRLLRQCNIIIHGDIEVNGKVVPLALAVKRIFSCIKNYGEVKIKIQSSTGIIKLKANSIIELIREIINLLEQFLINES